MDHEKTTHAFTAFVQSFNLSEVQLHDLRHIHASLMLQAGVHLKIISELFTHTSVTITTYAYNHVFRNTR